MSNETRGLYRADAMATSLGSGTALAERQASVAPQVSLVRLDGAILVSSSLCTGNDVEFAVWGSGWGSGELILLSVIKDADTVIPWFSGSVNDLKDLKKVLYVFLGTATAVILFGL
ncbi:MAG: hypothetical protein IIB59_07335, partial [Planctomycetes bacterium]|nr:hypothetical protein [Planctomycetota bacterium]